MYFFLRRIRVALKAVLFHLFISILAAFVAAGLLFSVWYPHPYGILSGGRDLFLIIVVVDVVCGPLMTLVLFNPIKPRLELAIDMGLVALMQMSALLYGIHTAYEARPLFLVHEVDRFRVITAAEIDPAELPKAPSNFRELSWSGPRWIATRAPRNSDELLESINLSLSGLETSLRPDWWESLEQSKSAVQRKLQTVERLVSARPQEKWAIERVLSEIDAKEHVAAEHIRWLPVVSSKSNDWVVFVERKSLKPLAALPIDGFIEN